MKISDTLEVQFKDDGTWLTGTLVKIMPSYLMILTDRGRERVDLDEIQHMDVHPAVRVVNMKQTTLRGALSSLGTSADLWSDMKSGCLNDGVYGEK